MKIVKEFKEFISRGNVIDLAVGVIIGGAFGKIVTSLVEDIVMPPIGVILGGVNFTDLKIVIQDATTNAEGKTIPEVAIKYGNFFQILFNFLIISLVIFLSIKAINRINRKKEQVEAKKAKGKDPEELIVLREIRDLLAKDKSKR